MIRAIIFDCFGVLYQGSLDYFISKVSPDSRQALMDLNLASDRGFITHSEYIDSLAVLVSLSSEEVSHIINTMHHRNQPVFELARSLKKDYKVGLLSNAGSGVMQMLFSEQELHDVFDVVIVSGEIGMVKPFPEIFELVAERLGESVQECLMIDDLDSNIEGAQAVGMSGIVYRSLSQLEADLDILL